MYCRYCGSKNESSNNFCTSCGKNMVVPLENVPIYNMPKKKDPFLKVAIIIVVSFISVVVILGICFLLCIKTIFKDFFIIKSREIHSDNELLSIVDGLDCDRNNNDNNGDMVSGRYTTDDKNRSCNIKDKYEVLSRESTQDENGNDIRTIYLKLKDYDFEFSIKSSKECISFLDTSCLKSEYVATTDYQEKASEYFYNRYIEQNNNSVCNGTDRFCSINKEEDIDMAVKYIFDYIQYINDFDFRFLTNGYSLTVDYPGKQYPTGRNLYTQMTVKLQNGKYVIEIRENGEDKIVTEIELKEYLLNYAHKNEIF